MRFLFIPGKNVEVPDIPYTDKVVLPALKTALIVGDMQNDFVKPNGKLVVPAASETIIHIQKLLESARNANVHIVHTQDTMTAGDPEFDIWPEHCVINTWGWEIIDELKPMPHELICQKSRYDAFYGTSLDHFLGHAWKVENVVIVGTMSNVCVLHAAASAAARLFHIVIPADGISALHEFGQATALYQITSLYAGKVVKSVGDIQFES